MALMAKSIHLSKFPEFSSAVAILFNSNGYEGFY